MNWFLLSISAMVCFVVYDLLSKIMSVESKKPILLAGYMNFLAAIIAISVFIISGDNYKNSQLSLLIIVITVIVMIVWGIYGLIEYRAKKITELSEFYIILKLAPIFTFLISYIFFDESLTLPKIIAFVLTIIANILISFDSNFKFRIHKGVILSLIVAILLGLGWALDKAVSSHYSPAFYVFLAFFAPASNILLLGPYKMPELRDEIRNTNVFKIILIAAANSIGYLLMITALDTGEVSKVVLIISMAAIFTVFLAIFVLKETEGAFRKIIATILVVIATILLI